MSLASLSRHVSIRPITQCFKMVQTKLFCSHHCESKLNISSNKAQLFTNMWFKIVSLLNLFNCLITPQWVYLGWYTVLFIIPGLGRNIFKMVNWHNDVKRGNMYIMTFVFLHFSCIGQWDKTCIQTSRHGCIYCQISDYCNLILSPV